MTMARRGIPGSWGFMRVLVLRAARVALGAVFGVVALRNASDCLCLPHGSALTPCRRWKHQAHNVRKSHSRRRGRSRTTELSGSTPNAVHVTVSPHDLREPRM
jgi:hypothetical protein